MIHHPEITGPAASVSFRLVAGKAIILSWQVQPPFAYERLGRLVFDLLLDEPVVRVEKVLDEREREQGLAEETAIAKVLAPLGFVPDREVSTPYIVQFKKLN